MKKFHKVSDGIAVVLWLASLLGLVMAWVATFRGGTLFGLVVPHWYWGALITGVLSIGAKMIPAHCEGNH